MILLTTDTHIGGLSSLFFAFADLVIHSIFNTDYSDPITNKASSYLDLSPLYGSSEKQVDSVRSEYIICRIAYTIV